MKSPITFLHDEQHNAVEPVVAIRRAQADAIEHALRAMRTLPNHKAELALSTLAFELAGDGPQPDYRQSTRAEQKKLRLLRAMIKVAKERVETILKGMEI